VSCRWRGRSDGEGKGVVLVDLLIRNGSGYLRLCRSDTGQAFDRAVM
jgi:hypothetical protein